MTASVFNRTMCRSILFLAALLSLTACQVQKTQITNISDLPLKDTTPPTFDWSDAPLRANAQYILFEANSSHQRAALVGDYYFVSWDDAQPDKPVKLVMLYTQAKTGTEMKERVIEHAAPREGKQRRKDTFFFNTKNGYSGGDVLSWRIELWCDGKLVDARQSYLWE